MVGALRELKAQGASILMVEQNFAVARALGDRVVVMDDGAVVWTGAMAELAADPALQERLMGLSVEAH
jgi:branched-chain amino acid transport system ATP-binding protein